jgi:hypothetical protein
MRYPLAMEQITSICTNKELFGQLQKDRINDKNARPVRKIKMNTHCTFIRG